MNNRRSTRARRGLTQSRDSGRVVRTPLVLAYGVNETGYREVIGVDVDEAETQALVSIVDAAAVAHTRSIRSRRPNPTR